MNLLKLSFFLVLIVAVSACGNDDDNAVSCMQSDWVGTYAGTVECGGLTEDGTVTITASGSDAIIVKYETAGVKTEYDPLTPSGCNLSSTQSAGVTSVAVNVTLDGDNLTLKEEITVSGVTSTCNVTAKRN